MSLVFLSYASDDKPAARQVANALEAKGHEVWWDHRLTGGTEYARAIEQALEKSDRVIVLWSARAVDSSWVRDEATFARDAGKLVPASLDGSPPPLGFRQFHTVDLTSWLRSSDRPLPERLSEALDWADEASSTEPEQQRIAFCRTADGVTLAFSRVGEGPPLVKAANWLNHLEHEWESPLWRPWIVELSSHHTLLRYDERGNGMSDWDIPSLSFDLLVEDLATVVEAAGWKEFDLIAISQGSPVAIAYAARYPDRIRRMVLINGFAAGWRYAPDPEMTESWEALSVLAKTGWGKNSPAFRQTFTSQFFPDATPEQASWWNELQKKSATADNAYRFIQLFGEINVASLLHEVRVPTLVMHSRDDQLVPYEAGRQMAARIPGAEFITLESRNHILLDTDPAWPKLQQELRRFLG